MTSTHDAAATPAGARALQLARNRLGRLVLTLPDGTVHAGVVPVRSFPISAPQMGVSLVSTDGHELAWVDDLRELPEAQRALIESELSEREFMPVIERLLSVSTFSTPSTWEVQTDRGRCQLELKGEEDIRRLAGEGARLMIASAEGLHFLIPDLRALDRHSRRLIERFL
ncbi:DUF1854 domain-containing protein [Tibeticola sp.]|uniref:cyanophycin metabolism-associated DUF1854 family protein n=1 Tax=Tibeticola sp. TaxID=2005368 RepID=UPI0025DFDA39|nr:DUF1854 domain-containing protein [Tibeticola sp.]